MQVGFTVVVIIVIVTFVIIIIVIIVWSKCIFSTKSRFTMSIETKMTFSSVFALPEGHLMSYFGLVSPGHWLDVPNALLGCLYYTYRIIFGAKYWDTRLIPFTQLIASCALATTIFLAYQLTLLQELCLLCWTTHLINVLLWIDAFVRCPTTVAKWNQQQQNGERIKEEK